MASAKRVIAVCGAIRGLATRLRQAGAAGGMLAGAMATLVYCLHCPEMAVPFWGLWSCWAWRCRLLWGPRLLRW